MGPITAKKAALLLLLNRGVTTVASTPSSERSRGVVTCSRAGSRVNRLQEGEEEEEEDVEDVERKEDEERKEGEGEEEAGELLLPLLPLLRPPRASGPGGAMWVKEGEVGKESGPRRSCRCR